eukprot:558120-Pleurochrysis_carterae.AAC.2
MWAERRRSTSEMLICGDVRWRRIAARTSAEICRLSVSEATEGGTSTPLAAARTFLLRRERDESAAATGSGAAPNSSSSASMRSNALECAVAAGCHALAPRDSSDAATSLTSCMPSIAKPPSVAVQMPAAPSYSPSLPPASPPLSSRGNGSGRLPLARARTPCWLTPRTRTETAGAACLRGRWALRRPPWPCTPSL